MINNQYHHYNTFYKSNFAVSSLAHCLIEFYQALVVSNCKFFSKLKQSITNEKLYTRIYRSKNT